MYNPETMPAGLMAAHEQNDAFIEECVYGREVADDTHRLELLFKMYGRLKAAMQNGALFD
jgi:hypothetical protein